MEPTLGYTDLGLSNQTTPILVGLIRLTRHLIGIGIQTYWTEVAYLEY